MAALCCWEWPTRLPARPIEITQTTSTLLWVVAHNLWPVNCESCWLAAMQRSNLAGSMAVPPCNFCPPVFTPPHDSKIYTTQSVCQVSEAVSMTPQVANAALHASLL